MELANSFAVTGKFDADYVMIRTENSRGIPISFDASHADKISTIKNGETVTATGKITFPGWNAYANEGVCPGGYVLDLNQIAITIHKPQLTLRGFFDAKVIGWGDYDGMFAICENLDNMKIYCFVPPVHERLARSRTDYLVGSYVSFTCNKMDDTDFLTSEKISIIDRPNPINALLPPNKGCQAWDDFAAHGWPQARSRKVSAKLRREVFMRDGFKCRECGSSPDKNHAFLEVDHIIPFSRGGSSAINNLQTLCSECNAGKSDGMPSPSTLASLRLA
jgi:hypothetical protein